jgi:cytochrome c biogenesis protein CcmG/thiol:disulfide interchange protein DsbE
MGLLAVPLAAFCALAVIFAFALGSGDPTTLPSQLIGKQAPVLNLPAIEGLSEGARAVPGIAPGSLATGQVTVVNFWASWCAPCVAEHPLLLELKARTGVQLYGINYKDQAVGARRFLGRYGNPFAAVGADANGRAAIEWGVYGMPETFVVDGRGVVVFKHIGPISEASLRRTLIPAIEKARSPAR